MGFLEKNINHANMLRSSLKGREFQEKLEEFARYFKRNFKIYYFVMRKELNFKQTFIKILKEF